MNACHRFILALFLWSLPGVLATQGKTPSFVLFLVDDLGYMDVGAYNPNCFYDTPNVDALAKSGMKFSTNMPPPGSVVNVAAEPVGTAMSFQS